MFLQQNNVNGSVLSPQPTIILGIITTLPPGAAAAKNFERKRYIVLCNFTRFGADWQS